MNSLKKICIITGVVGLLCLTVAFTPHLYAANNNPCGPDIARFCKDVNPANNGIMKCLEEHESELSPVCREHEVKMEGLKGERREIARGRKRFLQDCRDDIQKFCKDADLQPGGYAQCIRGKENDVSARCKAWIKIDREEYGKKK
ncbi:MAG: cysteine rich repeat-containing protein [Deltaproteobacteria bacterium]